MIFYKYRCFFFNSTHCISETKQFRTYVHMNFFLTIHPLKLRTEVRKHLVLKVIPQLFQFNHKNRDQENLIERTNPISLHNTKTYEEWELNQKSVQWILLKILAHNVIILTESWLSAVILDSELRLSRYVIYRSSQTSDDEEY